MNLERSSAQQAYVIERDNDFAPDDELRQVVQVAQRPVFQNPSPEIHRRGQFPVDSLQRHKERLNTSSGPRRLSQSAAADWFCAGRSASPNLTFLTIARVPESFASNRKISFPSFSLRRRASPENHLVSEVI